MWLDGSKRKLHKCPENGLSIGGRKVAERNVIASHQLGPACNDCDHARQSWLSGILYESALKAKYRHDLA